MPFSRSRSPRHAQEPSSPGQRPVFSGQWSVRNPCARHASNLRTHVPRHRHHGRRRATTPLNASAIGRGQPAFSRENTAYRSDMRPTARPETHQNLIHLDKDHGARTRRPDASHGRITHDATEFFSSLRRVAARRRGKATSPRPGKARIIRR